MIVKLGFDICFIIYKTYKKQLNPVVPTVKFYNHHNVIRPYLLKNKLQFESK